jgi:hypothetical protein
MSDRRATLALLLLFITASVCSCATEENHIVCRQKAMTAAMKLIELGRPAAIVTGNLDKDVRHAEAMSNGKCFDIVDEYLVETACLVQYNEKIFTVSEYLAYYQEYWKQENDARVNETAPNRVSSLRQAVALRQRFK